MIEYEWPQEAYQKTEVMEELPTPQELGESLALIMGPNIKKDQDRVAEITTIIPELPKIIERGVDDKKIEVVSKCSTIRYGNTKLIEESCRIFITPHEESDNVEKDSKNLLEIINRLKQEITDPSEEGSDFKIIPLSDTSIGILRKICEAVFYNSKWKIKIVAKEKDKIQNEEGPKKSEKIILKAGGRSYADLLRDVRKNVDVNGLGVNVERVKRTRNGDLLMEIKKADHAIKKDVKTVHILDIAGDLSKDEIIASLNESVGSRTVEVTSIRTTGDGNQAAIAKIDRRKAEGIINEGKIKVGISFCRIKEWVSILRCYKCLQYGHRRNECKEEDSKDRCFKCNKPGHLAKDCGGEDYCATCKEGGHRANQIACPAFRKMVALERRRRTSERTNY
ncbi:unnamed protein product [Phyllotreta striolata]|uniref:CCHC-type domain-containing protein n=1 Tax=Phyllotreta striolata TaxID=444603 RepID=A0A9P0GS18_PHYSR|nr:unnamed protein product [Phyllotreta striolata]